MSSMGRPPIVTLPVIFICEPAERMVWPAPLCVPLLQAKVAETVTSPSPVKVPPWSEMLLADELASI